MLKKILKLAGIGFLVGVLVGNLIASLSGWPDRLLSSVLVARAGGAAAALLWQTLFSGLLGAVSMAGAALYDVERWSLLRIALTHYVLIEAVYIPIALFLDWAASLPEILIMMALQAACYLLIFLIMYARYHREVRQLNDMNRQKNGE